MKSAEDFTFLLVLSKVVEGDFKSNFAFLFWEGLILFVCFFILFHFLKPDVSGVVVLLHIHPLEHLLSRNDSAGWLSVQWAGGELQHQPGLIAVILLFMPVWPGDTLWIMSLVCLFLAISIKGKDIKFSFGTEWHIHPLPMQPEIVFLLAASNSQYLSHSVHFRMFHNQYEWQENFATAPN